ncbi:hypothetical protein DPMN_009299 [Dreissena polymorpha]|uniref:Uncharacterized protein n=1 Tax=Dreissena polymorpha TaxID=45954 RepID=A0A9D4MZC5_DREPO|nr:hypothetical protein DPMN_009299 [Dreissena polymorpha]
MTVWEPGRDFQTVCDGARQSIKSASHPQETPRQSSTVPGPSEQLQETPRRCQKSPRPSGHLQENLDSLLRCEDRLVTSRILKDGLRRCQYRLGTCRILSESLTVPDSLSERRGTCR